MSHIYLISNLFARVETPTAYKVSLMPNFHGHRLIHGSQRIHKSVPGLVQILSTFSVLLQLTAIWTPTGIFRTYHQRRIIRDGHEDGGCTYKTLDRYKHISSCVDLRSPPTSTTGPRHRLDTLAQSSMLCLLVDLLRLPQYPQ